MKKFLLLGFFLMGCSDVDNMESDVTVPEAAGTANIVDSHVSMGGGSASPICNGAVEVREFEIDGKVYFLEIPIECTEEWQLLEDPENNVVEDFHFEGRVDLDN